MDKRSNEEMMEYFIKALEVKLDSWGMSVDSSYLAYGAAIVMVLLFALVVDLIARKVLIKLLERLASKTKNRIDDELMERGAIKSVILYRSKHIKSHFNINGCNGGSLQLI